MAAIIKPKDDLIAHAGGTGETVTVACKIPMGLELRVFDLVERVEVTSAGQMKTMIGVPRGRSYFVKGPAHETNQPAKVPISGGYALTRGIPADFWDLFCEQNKGSPMLTGENGQEPLLFASSKPSYARDRAKDLKHTRSGMEPLNPKTDPRNPPGRPEITMPSPDPDETNEFYEIEAA